MLSSSPRDRASARSGAPPVALRQTISVPSQCTPIVSLVCCVLILNRFRATKVELRQGPPAEVGTAARPRRGKLSGSMAVDRQRRAFVLGVLAVSASALAGCSSQLADLQQPAPPANASADAPADTSAVAPSSQPSQANTYLPVEDLPSKSDDDVITPAQRAKIEAELIAARDRQAAALQNAQAK
jgi:hypothetical protein